MAFTSAIIKWKIFALDKPEPHLQLSFECADGLLVKNLYLKHPNRKYTIKFLSEINATGSFRTLDDLQAIIRLANFRPVSVEWAYSQQGDKQIIKIFRQYS
ncbi:MAG: hypothetical protein HOO93_05260 [Methyloglobulus sp.]|nr:hypothetical protein [Methyloglobulus sp.]